MLILIILDKLGLSLELKVRSASLRHLAALRMERYLLRSVTYVAFSTRRNKFEQKCQNRGQWF